MGEMVIKAPPRLRRPSPTSPPLRSLVRPAAASPPDVRRGFAPPLARLKTWGFAPGSGFALAPSPNMSPLNQIMID